MFNLGTIFHRQGEDLPAAAGWFKRAAEAGLECAVLELGAVYHAMKEHEQARKWFTKGAEAGDPYSMYRLGWALEEGLGVAAPDNSAAAGWFTRAAEAGHGGAANALVRMYAVGRGVKRSKRRSMIWTRKAAENGRAEACKIIAKSMYLDKPYAREVGHVGEAAGSPCRPGSWRVTTFLRKF